MAQAQNICASSHRGSPGYDHEGDAVCEVLVTTVGWWVGGISCM